MLLYFLTALRIHIHTYNSRNHRHHNYIHNIMSIFILYCTLHQVKFCCSAMRISSLSDAVCTLFVLYFTADQTSAVVGNNVRTGRILIIFVLALHSERYAVMYRILAQHTCTPFMSLFLFINLSGCLKLN